MNIPQESQPESHSCPELDSKSVEELTELARSLLGTVQSSPLSGQWPYCQAAVILERLLSAFDPSLLQGDAQNIQVWKNFLTSAIRFTQTLLAQGER